MLKELPMVNNHRYHKLKKIDQYDEEDEVLSLMCTANTGSFKRIRPQLVSLLILSLLSCSLILAPHLFYSHSAFSLLHSFGAESDNDAVSSDINVNHSLCSSISNGTMCCDKSSIRSDVCIMKGDVRTRSASSSIFLYTSRNTEASLRNVSSFVEEDELQHEKIKPYTRKWETSVMDSIDELDIIVKTESFRTNHHCDVKHDVPAVFFSTGGYTGNVYHEFNDGILPLYITSQHFKKKVVFVILEYHNWWMMKYGDVLSHLSDYPAIDFSGDKRTHCFPEAIVGLRIHDELSVDPSRMQGNKSIVDFRNVLDRAYRPRIKTLIKEEEQKAQQKLQQKSSPSSETSVEVRKEVHEASPKRPKLVILSRTGSRAITNEDLLVNMAEEIGFRVQVVRPQPTTELARLYRALNSSEVMVGVHGAAMTHFLFMKPGSVFIQVIPLGTEWAADAYYGEPARKLGLKYIGYRILPTESSLYEKYDQNDPVLRDPDSVNEKGWQYTKSIYLDNQNVRLNLGRFQKRLLSTYRHSIAKMNRRSHLQSQ